MSDDIAEQLRELADKMESEDESDKTVQGYPVEETWEPAPSGKVYRDNMGDVWIDTESNESGVLCLGNFVDEFIDAIREANQDE